jgi:hypothetical protein
MGTVKALALAYAELKQITLEEALGVPLNEMQNALRAAQTPSGMDDSVRPPIPWVTIKSYVEVALRTVGLQDYTIAVVAEDGLDVTWEHCLIQISALRPVIGSSLSQPQPPIFQVKLYQENRAEAIEFQRDYTNVACICAEWLEKVVIKRALNAMEREWAAAEGAAESDAQDAERFQGCSLTEGSSELLDHEEPSIL